MIGQSYPWVQAQTYINDLLVALYGGQLPGDLAHADLGNEGLILTGGDRLLIAGSIRRRMELVSDVDLVLQPSSESIFLSRLSDLATDGTVDVSSEGWGERERSFSLDGVPFDLSIVRPPATWGVVSFLRTGSASWNERLIEALAKRGTVRFSAGGLHRRSLGKFSSKWDQLDTATERKVFQSLGLHYVMPKRRDGPHMTRLMNQARDRQRERYEGDSPLARPPPRIRRVDGGPNPSFADVNRSIAEHESEDRLDAARLRGPQSENE
tara:strand:+ start:771 stop:1571 length:801 start_codon:yes stop_codon:yes gene_type:complete